MMNILITGGTGFIGKKLVKSLHDMGHTISLVTRNAVRAKKTLAAIDTSDSIIYSEWENLNTEALELIDCVIHLAGASIATFPRNKKNKQLIYTSRIESTKKIVSYLSTRCKTFICGSAIGYYPSSKEKLYKTSYKNTHPDSFMEGLCVDREAEANKGKSSQRRVVTLRSGLVMGKEKIGHMIEKATKYFGGVVLGNGNQRMSLITVDERVTNCSKIIEDETIEGPVNMVSRYIQHKDYMRSVAKKLQRPVWWLKVPSFLLRFFLGEMSELVLGSQKVEPFNQ